MNKKKIYIIAFILLILLTGLFFANKNGSIENVLINQNEKDVIDIHDENYENYFVVENSFEDKIDNTEYNILNFKNKGFSVMLPKELNMEKNIFQKNTAYTIENESYKFNINNTNNNFTNAYEFILKDDHLLPYGPYEFGKKLFGDEYYGDFSYDMTADGTMIAKAAVLKNNNSVFGYKIYVINPNDTNTTTIEFLRPITEEEYYARQGYFFQFDEELVNFAYTFTYNEIGKMKTNKELEEMTELRKKIQTEIILMEMNEKQLTDMVEEGRQLTFEEYVAFLEYWGNFEKDAFEIAYKAGYEPSK